FNDGIIDTIDFNAADINMYGGELNIRSPDGTKKTAVRTQNDGQGIFGDSGADRIALIPADYAWKNLTNAGEMAVSKLGPRVMEYKAVSLTVPINDFSVTVAFTFTNAFSAIAGCVASQYGSNGAAGYYYNASVKNLTTTGGDVSVKIVGSGTEPAETIVNVLIIAWGT
ncbi:MAG: hypothetical protein HY687_05810, partial [Chloroflexi bacterium]|nr:hypothetical protein [Chloroflexota bacterium]